MKKNIRRFPTDQQPEFEHGEKYYRPLGWFKAKWGSDNCVGWPNFCQRTLDAGRVEEIKKGMEDEKQKHKSQHVLQLNVLSIAIMDNKRYIIDGQHRLQAHWELGSPRELEFQVFLVSSKDEMRDYFARINNTTPMDKYVLSATENQKNAYDKLIAHVTYEYANYIKPCSPAGRNNFPYISIKSFKDALDSIDEFKNCTADTIINEFEKYNLSCRDKMKSGKKDDRERVNNAERAAKENNYPKVLYISREIRNILKNN